MRHLDECFLAEEISSYLADKVGMGIVIGSDWILFDDLYIRLEAITFGDRLAEAHCFSVDTDSVLC